MALLPSPRAFIWWKTFAAMMGILPPKETPGTGTAPTSEDVNDAARIACWSSSFHLPPLLFGAMLKELKKAKQKDSFLIRLFLLPSAAP